MKELRENANLITSSALSLLHFNESFPALNHYMMSEHFSVLLRLGYTRSIYTSPMIGRVQSL